MVRPVNMESGKKNPWPLRILIGSMVCFVVGSIIVLGQMDAFGDALDPERNNISSIDAGDDEKAIIIDNSGCYRAYGVEFCLLYTSPSPRDPE